jgi:uncharacterized protein (DUF305 family)
MNMIVPTECCHVATSPQTDFWTITSFMVFQQRHQYLSKEIEKVLLKINNKMNTRVQLIYTLFIFFGLAMFSCSDDKQDDVTPAPTVQSHDENEMMSLLHEMTDSIDTIKLWQNHGEDFARYMEVSHQYAIIIGTKALSKGDNATMQSIAQGMISHKEAQLPGIRDFLAGHTPYADPKGVKWDAEAKAALSAMHANADKETLTGDADHDFAVIIKHHNQSTIDMANSYLPLGENPNLRALATQMITDATNDNKAIEAWLAGAQN